MAAKVRISKEKVFQPIRVCFNNFKAASASRLPLIAFPERPAISERYGGLEALISSPMPKSVQVPSKIEQPNISQAAPLRVYNNIGEVFKEEHFTKDNGVAVFVTDKLPDRYKRELISEEEIEAIMRGGPDV